MGNIRQRHRSLTDVGRLLTDIGRLQMSLDVAGRLQPANVDGCLQPADVDHRLGRPPSLLFLLPLPALADVAVRCRSAAVEVAPVSPLSLLSTGAPLSAGTCADA